MKVLVSKSCSLRGVCTRTIVFVLLGSLLLPSLAWAAPPAASPSTTQATPDQLAEARRRYNRALELSDEGNYDEALLELQRAYALAPTYRLLYNLGVVSVAVRDYMKAIDYFQRYLAEGGSDIEPARVAEVRAQIDRIKSRIARIRVDVSVQGADITVDDVPVGKSPYGEAIVLNAGRHKVEAALSGYLSSTSIVELAGGDSKIVTLTLMHAGAAEKPSRPIPWLGWGITAVLGAGTIVTGILALNAESNYDHAVGTVGVDSNTVASDYRKMRTLSITSDVFLGATIIAAGVSLYFTLKPPKQKDQRAAGLQLTPTGVAF